MTTTTLREELMEAVHELPILPTILTEVQKLNPNAEDYFERLTALAELDPFFATRVIHLANSARYLRGSPVMSVQIAITRLGTRAVTELLTTLSALQVFVPRTDVAKHLWTHSVEVAIASCRIATEARVDVDPGTLYLSALLHDVGRFMLLEHASELLGDVEESTVDRPEDLAHLERATCGIDHAELGALAAVAWELPDRIVDFIGGHHLPFRRVDKELREELQVLRLADRLTCWFHQEPLEEGLLPEEIDAYFARMAQRAAQETRLKLSPERLARVLPEIRDDAASVVHTLGL